MESLIQLSVTTVSAMVTLPLAMDEAADGRRKVRPQLNRKIRFLSHLGVLV
jgi:hypothetical protein